METKIVSVRLPADTVKELKLYCKNQNTTPSQFVRDKFTDVGQGNIFDNQINVDSDVAKTITIIGGGSALGIMAYKAVKAKLSSLQVNDSVDEDNTTEAMTEGKIDLLSMAGGVGVALLAGYGISKLLKVFSQLDNE
jgi:uncharacterized membrane protein YebE (DUF533 family)